MAPEVDPAHALLLKLDRKHVWHPYAAMPNQQPIFAVRAAKGVYLELENGRQLIDGMSSWWTCIHGYKHPALMEAAHAQLGKMAHVMFGGITHRPAVELVSRLIELTPQPLQQGVSCRLWFCCRGSRNENGCAILDEQRRVSKESLFDDSLGLLWGYFAADVGL